MGQLDYFAVVSSLAFFLQSLMVGYYLLTQRAKPFRQIMIVCILSIFFPYMLIWAYVNTSIVERKLPTVYAMIIGAIVAFVTYSFSIAIIFRPVNHMLTYEYSYILIYFVMVLLDRLFRPSTYRIRSDEETRLELPEVAE